MTVALGGACVNGAFTLDPLLPGYVYLGPTQLAANSCRCSTVYYSLLSACAYCQNQTYLDWSIYDQNCTYVYNQVFIDPIPSTIVVPHYAYLDVVTDNTFNVNAAMTAGGPESSPVPPATSATSATTAKATATNTSVAGTSKKVNIGAIVGGVVGGIAVFVFVVGLIVFIMRRRKKSVSTPSTTTYAPYSSPQMSGADMNYNSTVPTMTSGRIYDPNDPSTFPSYPNHYGSALPNDASDFPSNPVTYSTYSGSPQGVNPTITGNSLVGAHVPRTQYTGAPEL
jgi:hypothetical protein